MANILTKAMLVKLSISQFNPKRADDKVTQQVLVEHNAKREAGLWIKNLIDPKTLSAVGNAAVQTRGAHYRLSLPWADEGWRILPTSVYTTYQDQVREHKKIFDCAVEEFTKNYPTYIEDSRKALNGMFNEKDYPSVESVREKFGINVDFAPIPSGSDFRVGLDKEELTSMKEDVDKRVNDAIAGAMKDLWSRLALPIKRMVEKLQEPEAVFRNTLVDNIREIVEVIPSLNIADDPTLTAMVKECREKILKHTAEDIRETEAIRNEVRDEAEKLFKKMEGYL